MFDLLVVLSFGSCAGIVLVEMFGINGVGRDGGLVQCLRDRDGVV